MFNKIYELPLTRNYVANWKMQHAVRELIQNALDSESPFEWMINENKLTIMSRYTTLDSKTLLLGATSKAENDEAIGNFGEGYKIALLVLEREGYKTTVINGGVIWKPEFRHSKKFDEELLCIVESSRPNQHGGLVFSIELKDENDIDQIRACCLSMQDNIGEYVPVPQGRILLDRKGELYVGSLFICNTDLQYSYDINPEFIKLERDRQTVSDWSLQLITKEMWFKADRIDHVVQMIEKNVPDIYHADIGTPKIVADACYRHFKKTNPGAVIAQDQEELDRLVDAGMTKVIIAGGKTHYSIINKSSEYKSRPIVKRRTPVEILRIWIEENCPDLPKHRKTLILNQAAHWRLK